MMLNNSLGGFPSNPDTIVINSSDLKDGKFVLGGSRIFLWICTISLFIF
jgi:hypothetical protein